MLHARSSSTGAPPMTKQFSPRRQRKIDDMAFRNMSPNTHKVYAYAVANFAKFHRQYPDKLTRCCYRPRSGSMLETPSARDNSWTLGQLPG